MNKPKIVLTKKATERTNQKLIEIRSPYGIGDPLNKQIEDWWRTVTKRIYDSNYLWEEYLNDLDGRDIIEQVLPHLDKKSKESVLPILKQIDDEFIANTKDSKCVWGEINEKDNNWNKKSHWYYYRLPLKGQIKL